MTNQRTTPRRLDRDEDDDAPIRRTSRRRGFWTPANISAATGLAILAVVVGVAVAAGWGRSGRPAGGGARGDSPAQPLAARPATGVSAFVPPVFRPREPWHVADITRLLNTKGLRVQQSGGGGSCEYESVLYQDKPEMVLDYNKAEYVPKHGLKVWCLECESAEAAKINGDLKAAKKVESFVWDRFVFSEGPPKFRDHIRRVLTESAND